MLGFVSAISDQSEICIDVGVAEPVRVSSRFLEFKGPGAERGRRSPLVSAEISEEVADQWDEDEFEGFVGTDQPPEAAEPE